MNKNEINVKSRQISLFVCRSENVKNGGNETAGGPASGVEGDLNASYKKNVHFNPFFWFENTNRGRDDYFETVTLHNGSG